MFSLVVMESAILTLDSNCVRATPDFLFCKNSCTQGFCLNSGTCCQKWVGVFLQKLYSRYTSLLCNKNCSIFFQLFNITTFLVTSQQSVSISEELYWPLRPRLWSPYLWNTFTGITELDKVQNTEECNISILLHTLFPTHLLP